MSESEASELITVMCERSSVTASRRKSVAIIVATRMVTSDLASKIPVLIQKYQKKFPKLDKHEIKYVNTNGDPTEERGVYTEWLLRTYLNFYEQHKEYDRGYPFYSIKTILDKFDKLKNSREFIKSGMSRDINSYGVDDLSYMYSPLNNVIRKIEEDRALKSRNERVKRGKQGAHLVFRHGTWEIWKVELDKSAPDVSVKALCDLTHDRGWCTKDEGFSLLYLQSGPIYVLMHDGERVGLNHPARRQFKAPFNSSRIPKEVRTVWEMYSNQKRNFERTRKPIDKRQMKLPFASRRHGTVLVATLADRIPVLLQKYGKKIPNLTEENIRYLNSECDPTSDQALYTEWLVRQSPVLENKFVSYLHSVFNCLEMFNTLKRTREFKDAGLNPDINRYTVDDLVVRLISELTSVRDLVAKKRDLKLFDEAKKSAKLVYREGNREIYRIDPPPIGSPRENYSDAIDTLCELTKDSGWCVRDRMWALRYLIKGSIYVILEGNKRMALYSPKSREFRGPNNKRVRRNNREHGWTRGFFEKYNMEEEERRLEENERKYGKQQMLFSSKHRSGMFRPRVAAPRIDPKIQRFLWKLGGTLAQVLRNPSDDNPQGDPGWSVSGTANGGWRVSHTDLPLVKDDEGATKEVLLQMHVTQEGNRWLVVAQNKVVGPDQHASPRALVVAEEKEPPGPTWDLDEITQAAANFFRQQQQELVKTAQAITPQNEPSVPTQSQQVPGMGSPVLSRRRRVMTLVSCFRPVPEHSASWRVTHGLRY